MWRISAISTTLTTPSSPRETAAEARTNQRQDRPPPWHKSYCDCNLTLGLSTSQTDRPLTDGDIGKVLTKTHCQKISR
jgi:hypothetical protein